MTRKIQRIREGISPLRELSKDNSFSNCTDKKPQQIVNRIETGDVVIDSKKVCSDTVDVKVSRDIESAEQLPLCDNDQCIDPTESCTATNSTDNIQSFAIPDGLAMDPLSPTALAVSAEFVDRITSGLSLLRDHGKKVQKYVLKRRFDILKKSWKSVVNIVLIDAKGLPDSPSTGSNGVYCKFRLGTECHKSKAVAKTSRPTWRERFNLYLYDESTLELTVWHKGKQKNFMGRCLLDLSRVEKEKTHELWQELECGYGTIHMLVTLSGTVRSMAYDNIPTTNGVKYLAPDEEKFAWYRLGNDWNEVGQLSVVVHCAKGLSALGISGKADAYCVLELDNARVQTHTARASTEPSWNKSYIFGVHDVTSTLDITIYDESIINSMKAETLGKVSIPLLRINNDEKRWYALKDRSKKSSAKGNCPRILLEMSIVWNPIKASLRVLSPKETKYVQKPPKFNIPLIYSNLEFIKKIFDLLFITNEHAKRLFEWENRNKSAVALSAWLIFWYSFRIWMAPLIMLVPFLYHWTGHRSCNNTSLAPSYQTEDEVEDDELDSSKVRIEDEKSLKNRINGLQDLTFTIKNGIDYSVSLIERLHNLTNFAVPYLSFIAIIVLLSAAAILYVVPVNYLIMAVGIYKFTRKLLRPRRVPNNDVLDFLSRVPDNEILKKWRELKVPEPNLNRSGSTKRSTRALTNLGS